ncbi:predicted protein [Arabidopsis lyrata subsp. lyrata]|uniref:Predicted protein n=1 Tax=Arabidopsis lyrata subsp. lyrata TaxID=81972 RepID=D7MHZ5_ARALL|nr:predicted protein [Arabidopsis lyrata subsp. lyrata]
MARVRDPKDITVEEPGEKYPSSGASNGYDVAVSVLTEASSDAAVKVLIEASDASELDRTEDPVEGLKGTEAVEEMEEVADKEEKEEVRNSEDVDGEVEVSNAIGGECEAEVSISIDVDEEERHQDDARGERGSADEECFKYGNPTSKYMKSLRFLTQKGHSQEAIDCLGESADHSIFGHYAYGLFLICCGAVEDGPSAMDQLNFALNFSGNGAFEILGEVFSRGSRCGFISYQNRKKTCEGKGFRFGWGVPRILFLKEVCGFRGFRSAKGWSDCVVLVVLMVDLDSSNLDLVSWFSVSDFAWEERRISFQIRSIQKDLWSFSVKPFQKWGDHVIYLGLEVEELRIGGLQLPGWVLLLLDLKIVGGMNVIGAADQVGFDEIDTPFVRFWFSVYRGFCSKLVAGIGSIQEAFPIWFYGGSEGVVRWLLEHSQSWRWAMGQRFPQGNGLWASNLFGSEMFYHPFLMFDLFRRSSVSYTVFNSHNFLDRERNISVEISDQKGKNCSRLEKLISGGFSLDEYGSNVEGISEEAQKGDADYKLGVYKPDSRSGGFQICWPAGGYGSSSRRKISSKTFIGLMRNYGWKGEWWIQ